MIDVYFATNRNHNPKAAKPVFGTFPHPNGPQFFRVGKAGVQRTGPRDDNRSEYKLEGYEVFPEAPPKDGRPAVLGSAALFDELRNRMKNGEDLLVFLHGFSNTFTSALERAAEVADKYRMGNDAKASSPIAMAFAWPSDGEMQPFKSYHSDRQDAAHSGTAMARALLKLLDFLEQEKDDLCRRKMILVAHSMGNWALSHAVQAFKLLANRQNLPVIFDQVFLMGADEDEDAFESEEKLAPLTRMARRIHVYHSEDDRALDIADATKGLPDRLGEAGPRTLDGISTKVIAIDCRAVSSTRAQDVDHQYYRLRPEVLEDVRQVLSGAALDDIANREIIIPGRKYRIKSKSPKRDGGPRGGR